MLDKMLNVVEAAEFLGVKPATVRKWRSKRRLPFVKVGQSAVRFKTSELAKFLRDGERPAITPQG